MRVMVRRNFKERVVMFVSSFFRRLSLPSVRTPFKDTFFPVSSLLVRSHRKRVFLDFQILRGGVSPLGSGEPRGRKSPGFEENKRVSRSGGKRPPR